MAKRMSRKARSRAGRASKPARGGRGGTGSAKPSRVANAPVGLRLAMFKVDAFTRRLFHGNPAAVVLLDDRWLGDDRMQAVAAENNLSETAFLLPRKGKIGIRWFTPTKEVDLCGHATLASAHVLWRHVGFKGDRVVFTSASGELPVDLLADMIVLDFPAMALPAPGGAGVRRQVSAALGREPSEVLVGRDLLAVFENKRDVHELAPDFAKLRELDGHGVIATAPGAGHDFVSRYFAPKFGVDEDPVTGSAHCTLTPYWAKRLRRTALTAHQVSRRGGELVCELVGKRVRLGGYAVTYADGMINV